MNLFQTAFNKLKEQFDSVASPKPSASNSTKLDAILRGNKILSESITLLNERIESMAVSLDALSAEVDRANTVSAGAIAKIEQLVTDMGNLAADFAKLKDEAAANSVDAQLLDQLIGKLRTSSDALEATLKK